MRAISLWEPWATAIAAGLKHVETRGWEPDAAARGPLAICAAKTEQHWEFIHDPSVESYFQAAGITQKEHLNFGCIVAVVTLSAVLPVERVGGTRQERAFGNYEAGRFAWLLTDIRRLRQPIPFRGARKFFPVPDTLLQAQLP